MPTPPDSCMMTPNMMITPEGGLAVRVYNNTGTTLLKGRVVKADVSTDDAVVLTAPSDLDPIGIVYTDISNGQWGWIVVAGIADVYVDNVGVVNREDWLGTSNNTAGQCTASTIPVPPNANAHFQEVGHTIRGRTGAGLVRAFIHFN